MQLPQKYHSYSDAKKKIEHYCAYQERCHKEVVDKLRSMGIYQEERDRILGHLIEENYLNETRFAQAFARGKFRIKKWGRNRIIGELQQRNISDYNLKKGLAEIEESEYLETLTVLAKKFWDSNAQHVLVIRKKKVINALYYRGWETDLIYDQIRGLEKRKNS